MEEEKAGARIIAMVARRVMPEDLKQPTYFTSFLVNSMFLLKSFLLPFTSKKSGWLKLVWAQLTLKSAIA